MNKLLSYLKLLRAPFFTASIVPVLVGTSLAYAVEGVFNLLKFLLALFAAISLHAGANIANDYFDHKSGNDRANRNPTPFSGGSRIIQEGKISPAAVLTASLTCFIIGIIPGAVLLFITKSLFLLLLGLIGLSGGYFYTAGPIKLGYRTAGEITIGLLFGILPVYGAYYVQTLSFDIAPILPGTIIAVLIFLVILANEFADAEADRAVNKRTIVVVMGAEKAVKIYKIAAAVLCLPAFMNIFVTPSMFSQGIFFVILVMLVLNCLRFLDVEKLSSQGYTALSKAAILTHLVAGLSLTGCLLISKII